MSQSLFLVKKVLVKLDKYSTLTFHDLVFKIFKTYSVIFGNEVPEDKIKVKKLKSTIRMLIALDLIGSKYTLSQVELFYITEKGKQHLEDLKEDVFVHL